MARGTSFDLRFTPWNPEGFSLEDSHLVSTSPETVQVVAYEASEGEAIAEILALGAGMTRIVVTDADDNVRGEWPIEVRAANRLLFTVFDSTASIVYNDKPPGFERQYAVAAGSELTLETALYSDDDPLNGTFNLSVEETTASPEPLPSITVMKRWFSAPVTAGDHDLTIEAVGLGFSSRLRLTGLPPEQ
jgi:hypothetical protein